MPFSNTYANNILGWAFGKNSLANHSKVYIGLCSNDPEADNGTFTELTGGNKQITWAKSTADWKQAKGFGLFATETGGTPYFYGKLKTPVTCASGEVALFDPNSLKISIAATDTETT